jgi:hypothetical protein
MDEQSTPTVLATAPVIMATFVDIDRNNSFIPVNNGDDLAQYVGARMILALLAPNCALCSGDLAASFRTVLAAEPLAYGGPLLPSSCPCI